MFGIVKYNLSLGSLEGEAHLQTWLNPNCVIGYYHALDIDKFFMVGGII